MTPVEPRDDIELRYAVGSVLGHGSFGVVYRAIDRERGEAVALKKLHRMTPHAIYRFKQEFRSVAHVRHPNLVRLHELRSVGDDWYLSMELVDGVDFLTRVRPSAHTARADPTLAEEDDDGSLPSHLGERPAVPAPVVGFDEPRLRDAFRQLAEGVSALHATGTLHRDIKPTNVRVTPDARVVLLDFSLVTDIAADEQSRVVGGTPQYMAPEHTTKAPLTAAADWYSVGVMLYEALTGLQPFSGARFEMLVQKTQARPTSPGELLGGLPPDLVALCDDLLEIDPERRPTGAEVLRRLGAAPGPKAAAARSTFVGRAEQLAALHTALGRARGRPVVRVVEGASGMGKSVLVRHFLREVARRDPTAVPLAARCYEREAVRFKGLDGLVDALARYLRGLAPTAQDALVPRHASALVRLFPVLGGVNRLLTLRDEPLADSAEERRRAVSALRELLGRMADRWPVALFVDDVQWSDSDSATLLAEILRPPDAPGVVLVLACRREELERAPLLTRLLEIARDERDPLDIAFVHVDELADDDARSLARSLAGASGEVDRLVAEAGGNPYFLDQLAQRLSAAHADDALGAAAPVSVDAVIRERVAELPDAARRLLEAVAVAGRPIPWSVAARAADVSTDASAVELLLGARLVRAGGSDDEVEAWHDRVRESVVAGKDPAALRGLHLRIADVLEAGGDPDAEVLADHLVAAGEDQRAAEWSERAGDAAMRALAFDRAGRHYAAALERGADPFAARVKYADALAAAGKGAAAARVQLAAAEHAPPAAAQRLRGDAALQLLLQGHYKEGIAVLSDALGRIGLELHKSPWAALWSVIWRRAWLRVRGLSFRERPADAIPPIELARIDTLWSGSVGLATYDQVRSLALHLHELTLALKAGEPMRMARALSMEFLYSSVRGSHDVVRTERLRKHAGRLAEACGDARVHAGYLLNCGISAFLNGRFVEARGLMESAGEEFVARCGGNTWERDNLNRIYQRALMCLGDLRTLGPYTLSLVHDAEGRGDATISLHLRLRAIHLVRLTEDAPEGVVELLDGLLASVSGAGFKFQHFVHMLSTCETDLYAGRSAAAWNRIMLTWPKVVRSMLLRVQATRVEGAFMRGRCALAAAAGLPPEDGRRRTLLAHARQEERALRVERVPWGDALAELLGAARARLEARPDATSRLSKAAEALEAVDMLLHANCARLVAAGWRGGEDSVSQAWFAEQGVRAPERLARVYVAGT